VETYGHQSTHAVERANSANTQHDEEGVHQDLGSGVLHKGQYQHHIRSSPSPPPPTIPLPPARTDGYIEPGDPKSDRLDHDGADAQVAGTELCSGGGGVGTSIEDSGTDLHPKSNAVVLLVESLVMRDLVLFVQ
jgi:hypothetical protein